VDNVETSARKVKNVPMEAAIVLLISLFVMVRVSTCVQAIKIAVLVSKAVARGAFVQMAAATLIVQTKQKPSASEAASIHKKIPTIVGPAGQSATKVRSAKPVNVSVQMACKIVMDAVWISNYTQTIAAIVGISAKREPIAQLENVKPHAQAKPPSSVTADV